MEVIVLPGEQQIGSVGADVVSQHVIANPEAVLGLATGSSPLRVYGELGRRVAAGELSLSRCRAFLLDEYLGLPHGHPESYRRVIERDFVERVDIDTARVLGPDGSAEDVNAACADYEARIAAAGGVDIQLLGVGSNGHIAFNEPGTSLASSTQARMLTQQTRRDNARFFDGQPETVPQHCLTQGIGTILRARHLLFIALGDIKAEAVHQLVEGSVSAFWPVSALQLHPHVTVLLDEAAASRLQLRDYYRDCAAHKLAGQGY